MQVGVNRHQPVDLAADDAGEGTGGNGFTRLEPTVLAHVGEVGADQANGCGAQVASGGGGKEQWQGLVVGSIRSEEHTSELQSLLRISYAVFCLKKQTKSRH